MSKLSPAALQARVIVDELIRNGVRDAVLCPGSRSSALAFALQLADAAGRLTLHVRIDERSAGFLALGLAGETDRPVVVVCTSGSAVANLHPAAVEARYNHRRVVFLTANRPPEMQGVGAQQTINQQGIFAHDVVDFLSLPVIPADCAAARTDADPGSATALNAQLRSATALNAQLRSALCRIMLRSTLAHGPIHIDAPFREPLVSPADVVDTHLPAEWEGRPHQQPWTVYDSAPVLDLTLRTLVIAGQSSWEMPELAGIPTLCEPGGRTAGMVINPLALPQLTPEQVVVVGKPTLHRSVTALLARTDIPQLVLAPHYAVADWADVPGNAHTVASTLSTTGQTPAEWFDECAAAHHAATQHCRSILDNLRTESVPSGLLVAEVVGDVLEHNPTMMGFIGSSNPVRDLAITHPAVANQCVVNRGASGIDGNIATAVGIALRHPHPVIALLGDLASIHDMGSLLVPTMEERPHSLTIVVANDHGGGIFATLEPGQAAYRDNFERVFGTPHAVDFSALAAAMGAEYLQCELAQLAAALTEPAPAPGGVRLLEVATSRTDRHTLSQHLAAVPPAASSAEGDGRW